MQLQNFGVAKGVAYILGPLERGKHKTSCTHPAPKLLCRTPGTIQQTRRNLGFDQLARMGADRQKSCLSNAGAALTKASRNLAENMSILPNAAVGQISLHVPATMFCQCRASCFCHCTSDGNLSEIQSELQVSQIELSATQASTQKQVTCSSPAPTSPRITLTWSIKGGICVRQGILLCKRIYTHTHVHFVKTASSIMIEIMT